jgi:hypothetical protein
MFFSIFFPIVRKSIFIFSRRYNKYSFLSEHAHISISSYESNRLLLNSVFKTMSDVISVCSELTVEAGVCTFRVSDFLLLRNSKFSQQWWTFSH